MERLTASIVLYDADRSLLRATVASLVLAGREAGVAVDLFLVDNGGSAAALDALPFPGDWRLQVLSGHGNVGFGRGHNLCIEAVGPWHLILNPDLELAPDALREALAFMREHPECGLLAPSAHWDDGRVQYLCKRKPAVLDLFLRGFAPGWLRRRFVSRLARYELQDLIGGGEHVVWDPPLASGCCMFFRSSVLRQLRGFDPRFFLYFEDFDLSLRAGAVSRIAYVPKVRVVHHGGHAARKGWRHIGMFVRGAALFYRIHGWRWW